MIDIFGTKSQSEREEEEVERLVRPLPKLKPPRRDRQRERVQERDPDLDVSRDPDMSMNRREIGGSFRSYIQAARDEELISVRRKEDDKVVQVSKKTLKGPSSSKYEVIKDKEEETQGKTDKGEIFRVSLKKVSPRR